MYNFLFYFTYIQNIRKDGQLGARILAALGVIFVMMGQAFALFELFKRAYKVVTHNDFLKQSNLPQETPPYFTYTSCCICIFIMFFSVKYYNKERTEKIAGRFENKNKKEFCTTKNTLLWVLLFALPLVVVIFLG